MRYVDRRGNVLGASQLVGLGLAHRVGLAALPEGWSWESWSAEQKADFFGSNNLRSSSTVPPTVKRGASGDLVKAIRMMLNIIECTGCETPPSTDGKWDYGAKTAAAVEKFQKHKKFAEKDVDGVVGPMTWKALFGTNGPFPLGSGGGTSRPPPPAYTPPAPAPPGPGPKPVSPGPGPGPKPVSPGPVGPAASAEEEDEWPMWKIGLVAGGAFVGLMTLGLLLTSPSPKKKGSSAAATPLPAPATPALAAPAAARANRRRRRR